VLIKNEKLIELSCFYIILRLGTINYENVLNGNKTIINGAMDIIAYSKIVA